MFAAAGAAGSWASHLKAVADIKEVAKHPVLAKNAIAIVAASPPLLAVSAGTITAVSLAVLSDGGDVGDCYFLDTSNLCSPSGGCGCGKCPTPVKDLCGHAHFGSTPGALTGVFIGAKLTNMGYHPAIAGSAGATAALLVGAGIGGCLVPPIADNFSKEKPEEPGPIIAEQPALHEPMLAHPPSLYIR